jgi:hypothetical protein
MSQRPDVSGRTSALKVSSSPGTIEQEEGSGSLFSNGAFVAPVHYTLVAVEHQPHTSMTTTAVYTGVLRFAPDAVPISNLLGAAGQLFTLETAGGDRLACRPIEPLGSSSVRWLVRLT